MAELLWDADAPEWVSVASKLLDAICDRSLIVEPFRLAAAGMDEAFQDPAVKNLYVEGLETVVRVPESDKGGMFGHTVAG